MSLWRILIVMYSRFCPRTVRDSFFTTVPAPWCGYTTLSPTLYKPTLPFVAYIARTPTESSPSARVSQYTESCAKRPLFPGIFALLRKSPAQSDLVSHEPCVRAEGTDRRGCAPA